MFSVQDTSELTVAGEVTNPPDFSITGMFFQADLVVQAVMILLIVSSLWSWSIIVNTRLRLSSARAAADGFEDAFWSGRPP